MTTLKEFKEQQYLSQEDLARKSEMTTGTITQLENGKQKPRYATVRKLARVLNLDPKDIKF